MLKILVAEDDVSTNKLLCAILKINGYEAIPAFNGEAALDIIDHQHIDLLLCDVMMPKMDGFALTQAIRDGGSMMPILMLTAKALPEDKHTGFLVGTDDYMTKPFSPSELVARVKGHIQRYQRLVGSRENPRPEILKVRGLEIDRESRRVWVNGKEVNMTSKEYDLLLFLAEHPDTVFSKDRLFDHVWGMDAYGDVSTITVHIKHIRDKIELNPDRTQYIETVWGVGYRFRG